MPIDQLSDIVRMPRLGKIHLGEKAVGRSGKEYPTATEHFVVPPEVAEVYGDKPTELQIMFPSENIEEFAPQWMRSYSQSQGLVCISDGITARRKVDVETGDMPGPDTTRWQWHEMPCDLNECPDLQQKRCRRVMNLLFLLPDVNGMGVWQIDTSSFYSIVNINSACRLIRNALGRISMIPLTLMLRPQEVTPQGSKKQTVRVLQINTQVKLRELAQKATLPPAHNLLPDVTGEVPEDLFPEEAPEEPAPPAGEKAKAKGKTTEKEKAPAGEPAPAEQEKPQPEQKKAPAEEPPPELSKQSELISLVDEITHSHERRHDWMREVLEMRGLDFSSSTAQQLNALLQELRITKPTKTTQHEFLTAMTRNGYDKEQALEFMAQVTGKTAGRSTGELWWTEFLARPRAQSTSELLEDTDKLFD